MEKDQEKYFYWRLVNLRVWNHCYLASCYSRYHVPRKVRDLTRTKICMRRIFPKHEQFSLLVDNTWCARITGCCHNKMTLHPCHLLWFWGFWLSSRFGLMVSILSPLAGSGKINWPILSHKKRMKTIVTNRKLGNIDRGWSRLWESDLIPELQRRFFEDFGGGLLILDPWFCIYFPGKQKANLHRVV